MGETAAVGIAGVALTHVDVGVDDEVAQLIGDEGLDLGEKVGEGRRKRRRRISIRDLLSNRDVGAHEVRGEGLVLALRVLGVAMNVGHVLGEGTIAGRVGMIEE